MGLVKRYYNSACDCWMKENRVKTMTIYDILDMVGRNFPRPFTLVNIQSGFKVAGISPFNRNIFSDLKFLPSNVTASSLKFQKDLHHLQINLF